MKISSGVAPIPEMLKAHVDVGLGTDGAASNNNLNMIEEMHTMALLHKLNKMDPTAVPAEIVVRTATCGSARVLNMGTKIGSLEIGKYADIIFLDVDKPNTTPLYNVYSTIVYAASGSDVTDVIIDGKMIMKDRKILTTCENEVKKSANDFAEKIRKKLVKK
jgi:5-methylthioadenosine/S-adenosylhomocysteine deaminase